MTASERIIAEAERLRECKDVRGRKIVWRPLQALESLRLTKAAGEMNSSNREYMRLVRIAAMVKQIDHLPIPFPNSERRIEEIVAQLGNEGLLAVQDSCIKEMQEIVEASEQAAKDNDDDAETEVS